MSVEGSVVVPLSFTTDTANNPVPDSANGVALDPRSSTDGDVDDITGTGYVADNVSAELVPPPGAGFVTVTGNVPATAIAVPGTLAVIVPSWLSVDATTAPATLTTLLLKKLPPVIVIENRPEPAIAAIGEIDVSVGAGFATDRLTAADVIPLGETSVTVIGIYPPLVSSDESIVALSDVTLFTVVVSAVPATLITASLENPVPVTVSVNDDAPIATLDGDSDEMAGVTTVTVNGVGALAVPFGVTTITEPVVAPCGTVVTICDVEFDEIVASVPLNVTDDALSSLLPLIVTVVPIWPLFGEILATLVLFPTSTGESAGITGEPIPVTRS